MQCSALSDSQRGKIRTCGCRVGVVKTHIYKLKVPSDEKGINKSLERCWRSQRRQGTSAYTQIHAHNTHTHTAVDEVIIPVLKQYKVPTNFMSVCTEATHEIHANRHTTHERKNENVHKTSILLVGHQKFHTAHSLFILEWERRTHEAGQ